MFLITLFVSGVSPGKRVSAIILNFEEGDDVREDGVDLGLCFSDGLMEPAAASVDVLKVDMSCVNQTIGKYYDATITFRVTMSEDLPSGVLITVEIAFDTDMNATTGQSQPFCYFNGLGADWRILAEVHDGVVLSKSLDKYGSDRWTNVGEPMVKVGSASIDVDLLRSDLSGLVSSRFMVYVISENVVDMVSNFGSELPEFSFSFPPIAQLEAPSTIPEGTEVLFNALSSMAFDQYGNQDRIVGYMFDLDGDSVFEQSGYPLATTVYPDDGVVSVTLMVKDSQGFTDTVNHTVTVTNSPPTGLTISTGRELFEGEESSFSGGAFDVEADVLTYRWDFGDGTTAEGEDVTHTYGVEGNYVVTLSVTDDDGGASQVTETFMIQERPPSQPEMINFSWDWVNPQLLTLGLLVFCFVAFMLLVKVGVIEIEIVEEGEV